MPLSELALGILERLSSAPKFGRSAVVAVIQGTPAGVWINLGVDVDVR